MTNRFCASLEEVGRTRWNNFPFTLERVGWQDTELHWCVWLPNIWAPILPLYDVQMSFFIYNYFNDGLSLWVTRIVVGPALGFLIIFQDFLKVFLNLLQYCFCFMLSFVFQPWGMWDLSFPTRDWTSIPCIRRQSLNRWTTKEILNVLKCGSYPRT